MKLDEILDDEDDDVQWVMFRKDLHQDLNRHCHDPQRNNLLL